MTSLVRVAGPVAWLRIPARADRAHLAACLAEFDAVFAQGRGFASVLDFSEATVPSAAERQIVAQWLERSHPLQRRYNVATAFVIPSAVLRGAITAIHWVVPPTMPHGFFGGPDEAFAFVFSKLESAGIAVPGEARALRSFATR